MVASTTLPLVLHAEQEHARLRYTISLLLLVAFVLCFALLYLLIGLTPDPWPSYAVILSCLLSLPLTLVVMWLVEQQLKRVWHSGYQLVLDERGVAVIQPGREPFLLPWDNSLTPLAWYLRRRSKRPFTLANHPFRFQKINPVEVYDTLFRRPFCPTCPTRYHSIRVLSGKNGRYWLAEQRRWTEGLELTREDFEIFLQYLQTHNL
jgi:hypothetical protein